MNINLCNSSVTHSSSLPTISSPLLPVVHLLSFDNLYLVKYTNFYTDNSFEPFLMVISSGLQISNVACDGGLERENR